MMCDKPQRLKGAYICYSVGAHNAEQVQFFLKNEFNRYIKILNTRNFAFVGPQLLAFGPSGLLDFLHWIFSQWHTVQHHTRGTPVDSVFIDSFSVRKEEE